jgi:xanthine dehydrogenase small subunit
MRDTIVLYINGQRYSIAGEQVFMPVTDYLRYHLQQTGTKVVCAEGDCGACTVLLGRLKDGDIRYKPVNACIQYAYQLDCTHIVTIEGLKTNGALNPLQEAMVECHGAQCGYCTPGIVVAMCGFFQERLCDDSLKPLSAPEVREALTGNLCRCTGYEAILNAGSAVKPARMSKLQALYPAEAMMREFEALEKETLRIEVEDRTFISPVSLDEAVRFKAEHPGATIVNGGTDISVVCNKRHFEPSVVISLAHLPGLDAIDVHDEQVMVGALVSLARLEQAIPEIFPELHKMLGVFGSPQIKYAGTLAGNIANGSPIGDTLPFLLVMEAEVEVSGRDGIRRIPFTRFYQGYKKMDLRPDEIITRIFIPRPKVDEILKLYKVSRRKHLDIATFAAAIRLRKTREKTGEVVIDEIRIAYGGVGPIPLRLSQTEAFLKGHPFCEASFQEAGQWACDEIAPISDVRGHQDFRYQLARNILLKFYAEQAYIGQEIPT